MKKLLKILLYLVGAILLLIIGFASFVHFRGIPTYEAATIDKKVEITPERIEKGRKIAAMQCVMCHRDPTTKKLTGRLLQDAPEEFGEIWSANITQHKTAGIGNWTDGELIYLLRTGLKPDGTYLPPWMPKFVHMSDEDMESIIAFLRSDNFIVQPSSAKPPATKPSFLSKFLCVVAFKPFEYPKEPIIAPDSANTIEYGKYLVNGQLECYGCHSADFKTNNILEPELSVDYMAGGNPMLNMEREVVPTANITMDKETGIGNWTREEFVKAVKTGTRPNGEPMRYPMVPYVQLEEWEIEAIYAYIQTIPPVKKKIASN